MIKNFESNVPIIKHIPLFLKYCREKGLSEKTYENYDHYLKKLIAWLKKIKKEDLKPHELTVEDGRSYQLHLSRYRDEKGKPLKRITQHYYLIALRALLSYFTAKDIISLNSDKIVLSRLNRKRKDIKLISLDQTKELLSLCNIKTIIGLRNRCILEVLMSTGLKINQLRKLNKDDLEIISKIVSGDALYWIKRYLKTRKDNNKALFVNYRSRRKSDRRLTSRSIERITKEYGEIMRFSFSLTPEILRWSHAFSVSNEEVKINNIYLHRKMNIKEYLKECLIEKLLRSSDSKSQKLKRKFDYKWHVIEKAIGKETFWLKENIFVIPEKFRYNNPSFLGCDDCVLRKIAILIISGSVSCTEFIVDDYKSFWKNFSEKPTLNRISIHGGKWHRRMMDIVIDYFEKNIGKIIIGKVVIEPALTHGRADLGFRIKENRNLYIEIGDISSFFKLWYNLATMKNSIFLIISSEDKIIKFVT